MSGGHGLDWGEDGVNSDFNYFARRPESLPSQNVGSVWEAYAQQTANRIDTALATLGHLQEPDKVVKAMLIEAKMNMPAEARTARGNFEDRVQAIRRSRPRR